MNGHLACEGCSPSLRDYKRRLGHSNQPFELSFHKQMLQITKLVVNSKIAAIVLATHIHFVSTNDFSGRSIYFTKIW